MKIQVSSLKWCILYVIVLVIFPEIAFQKSDVFGRKKLAKTHVVTRNSVLLQVQAILFLLVRNGLNNTLHHVCNIYWFINVFFCNFFTRNACLTF